MLIKIQAGKELPPMYTPGETQDSRDRKAIPAEEKADSRTGRYSHQLIQAGKQKLGRVFRARGAGCPMAEAEGEPGCPRSCRFLWVSKALGSGSPLFLQ